MTIWQFFYGLATDDYPTDVEPPAADVFDPAGHKRYLARKVEEAETQAREAKRIQDRDAAVFRALGRQ